MSTNPLIGEQVLDATSGEVFRATDPVILPQPYVKPADFAAQYPQPLDPLELIAMCEEVTALQAIPERFTALKAEMWRELNELAFTSGSAYIAFADGECPEEYTHDGDNTTVTLKNLGAKKSLGISDIMHSRAIAGANWHGINSFSGPLANSEGSPGSSGANTIEREGIADVKEKEIALAGALVLNGWDTMLIDGDSNSNSLEFDGFENWATNFSCTMHTNDNSSSGTFSATSFDRWISESCATPTHIFGHPAAVQEMMSSYFQLGFQGSQVVNFAEGSRLTPGFNFSSFVNTGRGTMQVVADTNFTRTNAGGGAFQASLWAMRMSHNGVPLVSRLTQIPFSVIDLVPGCTAISFEVWVKTALVIKHCCAHGVYDSQFSGRIVTTCPTVG